MLDNHEMATAIRQAIDSSGKTQKEIADAFGVTEQAVSGWLRTGKVDKRKLPALAALTGRPLSHFGMGEPAVQVAGTEIAPGYLRVEQIDATAGMGGAVINDDHPEIIRSVEYREAYIRALIGFVPPPGRLKLVTGAGDSMRPIIEPGETLLMDSGVTTFQADGIYWIALGDRDDGHQIKMLQERGDGLWVISANSAYPPFPFPENGRIGGRLYIKHKIERFS